ncbi:MAG: 50S ribosomal protein L6 [Negativicoccus succinicivorans]|uniref:Large ribosomal subunit protein uL6 n=2 Tax=Negativicoccus succinicivorans TaxID=620903 RepID=A0A841R5V9_9FIRM|nr:50S ribosomal protein L6 [Negativicoccus succinicivorans]KGF09472.1 50S ribosomal protein L6 [Tissierellia bacterium S5-A11]ETI86061.1 MAG: 50S ribosomal protein L6 [Negativicoccus succinicivorans DORA_17_25]MBB6477912.1 large subunit ribosomal protein L6 [Negativicoccus succinicivorans]MBS5890704.1 50S ribosomal protein L6 [Negativicoccus succinicivorans]MBS5917913.1 50S ribosomal protein L6 [Negativicoccus succinicivorans]
MSRIGNQPIAIPNGVDITLDGHTLTVKGPKGTLSHKLPQSMQVEVTADEVKVTRPSDDKEHKSLHGLTRSLINNMVIGVTKGYSKTLEIVGVGYRAAMKGKNLNLTLGFSHPVIMEPPAGIEFETPEPTKIIVKGADKEVVGQVAAEIRDWRKPEPYKGKGVRYEGEHVRRKAGKTGAK